MGRNVTLFGVAGLSLVLLSALPLFHHLVGVQTPPTVISVFAPSKGAPPTVVEEIPAQEEHSVQSTAHLHVVAAHRSDATPFLNLYTEASSHGSPPAHRVQNHPFPSLDMSCVGSALPTVRATSHSRVSPPALDPKDISERLVKLFARHLRLSKGEPHTVEGEESVGLQVASGVPVQREHVLYGERLAAEQWDGVTRETLRMVGGVARRSASVASRTAIERRAGRATEADLAVAETVLRRFRDAEAAAARADGSVGANVTHDELLRHLLARSAGRVALPTPSEVVPDLKAKSTLAGRASLREGTVVGTSAADMHLQSGSGDRDNRVSLCSVTHPLPLPLGRKDGISLLYHNWTQSADFQVHSGCGGVVPSAHRPLPAVWSRGYSPTQPFGGWHTTFTPTSQSPSEAPGWVAVLPHAHVTGSGWAVDCRQGHGESDGGGYALSAGGCFGNSWKGKSPLELTKNESRHVRAVVPICDGWCRGYFHWTNEHLPRAALVASVMLLPRATREGKRGREASSSTALPGTSSSEVPLIFAPKIGFVRSFLVDVLGYPADALVNPGYMSADVVYYPAPMPCGNGGVPAILALRRIVFARFGLAHSAVDGFRVGEAGGVVRAVVGHGGAHAVTPMTPQESLAHKERSVSSSTGAASEDAHVSPSTAAPPSHAAQSSSLHEEFHAALLTSTPEPDPLAVRHIRVRTPASLRAKMHPPPSSRHVGGGRLAELASFNAGQDVNVTHGVGTGVELPAPSVADSDVGLLFTTESRVVGGEYEEVCTDARGCGWCDGACADRMSRWVAWDSAAAERPRRRSAATVAVPIKKVPPHESESHHRAPMYGADYVRRLVSGYYGNFTYSKKDGVMALVQQVLDLVEDFPLLPDGTTPPLGPIVVVMPKRHDERLPRNHEDLMETLRSKYGGRRAPKWTHFESAMLQNVSRASRAYQVAAAESVEAGASTQELGTAADALAEALVEARQAVVEGTALPRVVIIDEDFGKLPVVVQALLFNRADFMVGPHGANLSDLMFMRHGTHALEYVPGQSGNMCYYTLAARLGVRYHMHINLHVSQRQAHVVDIKELVQHFESVIGE